MSAMVKGSQINTNPFGPFLPAEIKGMKDHLFTVVFQLSGYEELLNHLNTVLRHLVLLLRALGNTSKCSHGSKENSQ